MRLFRSLTAAGLLALTVLAGAAGCALAASDQTTRYDLADAWCFNDGTHIYCTETDGFASFLVKDAYSGKLLMHIWVHTTVTTPAGEFVGEYTIRTHDQTHYAADGSTRSHSVEHTSSIDGGLRCVGHTVVHVDDFVVKVDHTTASCE